jgi:hypothetical protein
MYQLLPTTIFGAPSCIKRLSDNAFIPFAVDNTDYAQFKVALAEGVTLLDAEGIAITPEQVQSFLELLL